MSETEDPREEVSHDIEVDQVYTDSRSSGERLQLIYIDKNVYVFQRPDQTHRFGSRREFEDNVEAGRFSLQPDADPFAVTGELSEDEKKEVEFSELDGIGAKGASNLRNSGYETVNDVRMATDEELLDVPWVGEKGVQSIRGAT